MGCCFRDVWYYCCQCELSECVHVESPVGCALFFYVCEFQMYPLCGFVLALEL